MKKKEPKFKDIPWGSEPIGGVMFKNSNQKIYIAEVGEFTMVHVLSKHGEGKVNTYLLRKKKTTAIPELTRDLFIEKMELLGYYFDWSEPDENGKQKLVVKYKKKGFIKNIQDALK